MNNDHLIRLQSLKAKGAKIHINLTCRATPDTAESMAEESYVWEKLLLEAVKPFGPARAADFTTLTPYRPKEREYLKCLHDVRVFSPYHREAMTEHAVRMYRLDELLKDLSHGEPRSKPGRKEIDDDVVVDETLQIVATQKRPNKSAALDEALNKLYPSLNFDEREKMRNRIYRSKI